MQTNCPHCSQVLVVEDDKVPAEPFMLRCPKCQKTIKLPGKAGPAAPPRGDDPAPRQPAQPAAVAPPPPPATHGNGDGGPSNRALLALADKSLQEVIAAVLKRAGYGAEGVAEPEQAIRLLERNSYAVVVTAHNGAPAPGEANLYKRIVALAPEVRRDLFLILVGSELNSGDGTQAFVAMADLVLNPKDAAASEELLRSTITERARLYQAFLEAQTRLDERRY